MLGHVAAFDFQDAPTPDTPLTLLRWCRETVSPEHFAGLCKTLAFFLRLNYGPGAAFSLTDPLSEEDDGGDVDADKDTAAEDAPMLHRVLGLVEFALHQGDPRANSGAATLLDMLCLLTEALPGAENEAAAGLVGGDRRPALRA